LKLIPEKRQNMQGSRQAQKQHVTAYRVPHYHSIS
jgi:hypothetical protein